MARSILFIGDQAPSLPTVVKNAVTGAIIDLTGYLSAVFAFRQAYDTVNKWETAAVIVAPNTSGAVRYDLGVSDLVGLVAGVYVGQWTLTDASGRPQHVPAGEFEVRVAY